MTIYGSLVFSVPAIMMKLTFNSPYLSIRSLPETTLPDFTVITGVNGSGKTHLLEAIQKGHVLADIAPDPVTQSRFFDWNTMVPNDSGSFQTNAVYADRDNFIQWGFQARETIRDKLLAWSQKYAMYENGYRDSRLILRVSKLDIRAHNDQETTEAAWNELLQIGNNALNQVKRNVRNNLPMQRKLDDLHAEFGAGTLALTEADFANHPFGWGQVDVFQQSFAQLFLAYSEHQKNNLVNRQLKAQGNEPPVEPLSDEEFTAQHGEPPWDFVNRILSDARLDFCIDHPSDYSTTSFTPQLTKTTSGVELKFSSLSSGEKILMSFAFCLYNSSDNRQLVEIPKLLLFDEIDAPLHPSMSRQLVDTIRDSLVAQDGVKVILATHSPSTIAVVPESSIYVMKPDIAGVSKVGKQQAISLLTKEIPTLSVDFSGRRQVFVESSYDASRFEVLYRFLGSHLASERSLSFIATGKRKTSGEETGGCDQVNRIVSDLAESGNKSVFGLIDWDGSNKSSARVVVLAEDKRYAIENCLLDPLLVGALVVLSDRKFASDVGLSPEVGYLDLKSMNSAEHQRIVNAVERKVLKLGDDEFGGRIECDYVGGTCCEISKAYLSMNGHQLETIVKESFPVLNQYQNTGALIMKIIDPIVFDMSEIVPVELVEAFQVLLDMEITET